MNKYLPFIVVTLLIGSAFFFSRNTRVAQSHRSYEIDVIQKPHADQVILNEPTTIKYRIKNDKGEIVKNFAIAHEKLMHFIIVRKDLMQFQHLHPTFNKETGEFSVDVELSVNGTYRFFADFTPGVENPMKLPVVVYSDVATEEDSVNMPLVIDNAQTKTVDGYEITYLFPDEKQMKKQEDITYGLIIEKDGKPVNDLEPYLGARGHSVIIKQSSLDYIHTHALDTNQSQQNGHSVGHQTMQKEADERGSSIDFTTTFPQAGIYKIFTQFQHQGNVLTTEYAVEVK